jgi:hypothetical protein
MLSYMKKRVRNWLYQIVHSAVGDKRSSPSTQAALVHLAVCYRSLARQGAAFVPRVSDAGVRVYSQFEEDGMLLFLFAVLGTTTKTFVDIGSGDGVNSNCANLAINFGWHGLFIDGNQQNIEAGKSFYGKHPDTCCYPPKFVHCMVRRENINDVIRNAGFEGAVDLVSIDIDGNDYWIWDALECIQPRVVIIETHVEFGYHNIVVPYDKDYVYPGVHPDYHGASPVAMAKLANRLGYRLVGANRMGFNTIYVKREEAIDLIPEVSVEEILRHPRNQERFKLFDAVKHMPYVEGGTEFPGRPIRISGASSSAR